MAITIPDLFVNPGELKVLSVNISGWLATGETIASVLAGVEVWPSSPVTDPNASQLLRGTPSYSGTLLSAWVGGIPTTTNFLTGAVYTLVFQVTTSLGEVFIAPVNINVATLSLPTFASGATIPTGEYTLAANAAPTLPGTYLVTATGLAITIPAASVGGDMVFVDMTGAVDPAMSFSGTLKNTTNLTDVLPRGGRVTLHWVATDSGYVAL